MGKIYFKKGYKYQLHLTYRTRINIRPKKTIETDFINLDPDGNLTIKAGYAWDGPSGPTFDTKSFMRGSLIHDAIYQLISYCHLKREDRKKADQILKKICLEDGMFSFRAWYVYRTVKRFGSLHLKPINILTAP